jgi:hypothetical protein
VPRKEKKIRRGWKWTLFPVKQRRRCTEKNPNTMKFIQINLQHSKAAMAVLCQQLPKVMADTAPYSGTLDLWRQNNWFN